MWDQRRGKPKPTDGLRIGALKKRDDVIVNPSFEAITQAMVVIGNGNGYGLEYEKWIRVWLKWWCVVLVKRRRWRDVKICSFDDAIHQTYVNLQGMLGMLADLKGGGCVRIVLTILVDVVQVVDFVAEEKTQTSSTFVDTIASKSGYHFFRTSAGDVFHDAPKEFLKHQNTVKVLK
ncbi:hypothetical protein Tco_0998075, partial [Tanacetum coccineum]